MCLKSVHFWVCALTPILFCCGMVTLILWCVKSTDHAFALLPGCLCSELALAAQKGFMGRRNKQINKQRNE